MIELIYFLFVDADFRTALASDVPERLGSA
jgi:hypothetical protein